MLKIDIRLGLHLRQVGIPNPIQSSLTLSRHILVLDMDALAARMARRERSDEADLVDKVLDGSLSLEFEGYLVIARIHHGWEAVSTLLVELHQADDAMLDRLLRRCARLSTE